MTEFKLDRTTVEGSGRVLYFKDGTDKIRISSLVLSKQIEEISDVMKELYENPIPVFDFGFGVIIKFQTDDDGFPELIIKDKIKNISIVLNMEEFEMFIENQNEIFKMGGIETPKRKARSVEQTEFHIDDITITNREKFIE